MRTRAPEATEPVTLAQLQAARAAMKLWTVQTQTRRAEDAARKACVRGAAVASACSASSCASSARTVLAAWVACK